MRKSMKYKVSALAGSILTVLLAGCVTFDQSTETADRAKVQLERAEALQANKNYVVVDRPYSDKMPTSRTEHDYEWLKRMTVKVVRDTSDQQGIQLKALLDTLNRQGLRITTTLPADRLYYRGFSIPEGTDGLTALQIITEQMGADYIIHSSGATQPYVSLVEMGSDTHRLNVPDVKTGLSILNSSLGSGGGNSEGQQGGQTQGQGGGSQQGQQGGMQNGSSGQGGGQGQGGGGSSSNNYAFYTTQFWDALKEQLEAMMMVPMPTASLASANEMGMPMHGNLQMPRNVGRQVMSDEGGDYFEMTKVGRVVVNPTTGYINVAAPKHIRKQVADHINELQVTLNTRLVVKAELVTVTTSSAESRGINVNGFRQFVEEKYGVVLSNNVLGNITTSMGDAFSAVADGAIAPSLVGVQKSDGLFSAFSGYLETFGQTSTISEFTGAVRSGRTYESKQTNSIPRLETRVNNQANEGGTSSTSENETIYDTTGTFVSVTPLYDPKKGLINSLVNIQLLLNAGEVEQEAPIVSDGNIEIRTTKRLAFDEVFITTEAPSKAGEVVIVGGYVIKRAQDDKSGVTRLVDTGVGGLFGQSQRDETVTKLYVLLTVTPVRYDGVI